MQGWLFIILSVFRQKQNATEPNDGTYVMQLYCDDRELISSVAVSQLNMLVH